MPVFQITSHALQPYGPLKPHIARGRRQWSTIQRLSSGGLLIGGLVFLFSTIRLFFLFFLILPVITNLFWTRFQLSKLLRGTFLYNVLTLGLSFLYFGAITAVEVFTHTPGSGLLFLIHGPPIALHIVVTTTLAWTIMLAPLYTAAQEFIERRFNRRNYETAKAIEDFTEILREEIDLDKVRDGLLVVVQKTMQAQAVSVWVRKNAQQALEGPSMPDSSFEMAFVENDPFLAYALHHAGAIEVERLQLDSPIVQILQMNEMEMVFPLASQEEVIGLLALGPRLDGEKYTREDRSLLSTLAAQVAPTLRVTQLVKEQEALVRERESIEQELRTAQEIQRTFLPKDVPALSGWQIMPYYQAAREVGGDFYDFLPFADGRVGLVIGDVTNKGIPAALVMTATRTMLRTAAQEKSSPSEVLAQVNDLLAADIPLGMFVTCFYAILEPASGKLRYANAGHELPYRQAHGRATELWATGMPLGMLPGTRYEDHEATLLPGESLFFYSDGLVEAHSPKNEMFGFPRLQALLAKHAYETSLIDFMLNELQNFTGESWEQEDDVTLLALQRAASGS